MHLNDPRLIDRFWAEVSVDPETECWVRTSGLSPLGYSRFTYEGKRWLTHRLVLWLATGELPVGKYACHHCDNPPCCNPTHLYWGAPIDNVRDAQERCPTGMGRNRGDTCHVGHPLHTQPNGHRACRTCQNKRSREYRLRRQQVA